VGATKMTHLVAPITGGDDILWCVLAAVLARKQMLCSAFKMLRKSKGYFVGARKAFAIVVPHWIFAVVAAAILLFISLLT